MDASLDAVQATVLRIRAERFASADTVFLCGSVSRGEATPTSDLDLVVLFPRVDAAWRESFTFESWPVECFCHDLETAEYYFSGSLENRVGRFSCGVRRTTTRWRIVHQSRNHLPPYLCRSAPRWFAIQTPQASTKAEAKTLSWP